MTCDIHFDLLQLHAWVESSSCSAIHLPNKALIRAHALLLLKSDIYSFFTYILLNFMILQKQMQSLCIRLYTKAAAEECGFLQVGN